MTPIFNKLLRRCIKIHSFKQKVKVWNKSRNVIIFRLLVAAILNILPTDFDKINEFEGASMSEQVALKFFPRSTRLKSWYVLLPSFLDRPSGFMCRRNISRNKCFMQNAVNFRITKKSCSTFKTRKSKCQICQPVYHLSAYTLINYDPKVDQHKYVKWYS